MLRKSDTGLAIEVLQTYETAWIPNSTAVSDIEEYLYWDGTNECFSVDAGMLLRGECENVQIFRGLEDWRQSEYPENRFDAAVIYGEDIFFIRAV